MTENQTRRNSLERKKRPWTIMIPRNAVQPRGEGDEGENANRNSVLTLNTPDGQPLDLQERDAFLEALRKHVEGKADGSMLIATAQEGEAQGKKS